MCLDDALAMFYSQGHPTRPYEVACSANYDSDKDSSLQASSCEASGVCELSRCYSCVVLLNNMSKSLLARQPPSIVMNL